MQRTAPAGDRWCLFVDIGSLQSSTGSDTRCSQRFSVTLAALEEERDQGRPGRRSSSSSAASPSASCTRRHDPGRGIVVADALLFPKGDRYHALEVDGDKDLVRAGLGYFPSQLNWESTFPNLPIRIPDFAAWFIHETGF
jgi:hypothetical protein